MANNFDFLVKKFQQALEEKTKQAEADSRKYVTMSCAEVERTAKTLMRDSPTNPEVTYGKKGHHPSLPGNAPAPDKGTLLQSITHSVEIQDGEVVGYVGSTIVNSDYPRYLEYGTSKMKPRPWLSASLIKCQTFMSNLFREIFGK